MLGRLLSGFITILVGVSLLPTVANGVFGAVNRCNDSTTCIGVNSTYPTNVTGASATIVTLMTLFFALGVMSAGIAMAVGGLQDAGLM